MKCQNSCYDNVSIAKNSTSPQFLLIQETVKMNTVESFLFKGVNIHGEPKFSWFFGDLILSVASFIL